MLPHLWVRSTVGASTILETEPSSASGLTLPTVSASGVPLRAITSFQTSVPLRRWPTWISSGPINRCNTSQRICAGTGGNASKRRPRSLACARASSLGTLTSVTLRRRRGRVYGLECLSPKNRVQAILHAVDRRGLHCACLTEWYACPCMLI